MWTLFGESRRIDTLLFETHFFQLLLYNYEFMKFVIDFMLTVFNLIHYDIMILITFFNFQFDLN